MKLYCADIEGDGLLDTITKVWCMSYAEMDENNKPKRSWTDTSKSDIVEMISNPDNTFVMHNGIGYDEEAMNKVWGDGTYKAKTVDTLILSWYLYPKRNKHGLAEWGEDLGITKPEIDDWENLTIDEYVHRCEEDVRIQTTLWRQIWKHLMLLYGTEEDCWHLIDHLNFKMRQAQIQAKSMWKLDVDGAIELEQELSIAFLEAKTALEAVMPKVAVKAKKSRPKKPFKMNGDMSATGEKWYEFCKEHKISFESTAEIEYIKGYKDPNAGSTVQLKGWLYSMGWMPEIFKFKRDKETGEVTQIPQIKDAEKGTLCPHIERMIADEPSLSYLRDMSVVKHRLSVVSGFLKNVDDKGFIYAAIQGITNTLRFKHKIAVNLPSGRKPYGSAIRGLLTTRNDATELCGSDMMSLEDRTKQHYMWPHDPEYVTEMMADGFDPHLDMAISAKLITPQEASDYKLNTLSEAVMKSIGLKRHAGKSCNYAATYGATGPTIARAAGVNESTGETLFQAYWDRNWSLKAIADNCIVKQSRDLKWLWNPVANIWMWLKAEKDRFSTLNQSTGTYAFDRWLWYVLQKRPQLTAQFHDEGIWELKKGNREPFTAILKEAVQAVNKELQLNRDLDVDVSFGETYADIH